MRVMLTGAFGNVGSSTIPELLNKGYTVRCFDLPTRRNQKYAAALQRQFGERIEVVWGDLRQYEDVEKAVKDCDVVAHVAFIIPPLSERQPIFSEAVNIGGTQNIVKAMSAMQSPPKLIFTSSIAIYGHQHDSPPPRTIQDPIQATDIYTDQKIRCETLIRESKLTWTILRLSAVQPLNLGNIDPLMFEVPLWQRIEFVHTHDVGLAIANAAEHPDVWGKTLLIAGGEHCRMTYREYIGLIFDAIGLGRLPDSAFTSQPFHTDWMDTEESQRLLQYQRYTYPEFIAQLVMKMGYQRHLARVFSPVARWWMLRQSPYYRK